MIIHDEEFGKITIRRSARARQIRIKLAPNGTLRASLPMYAPVFLLKRLLKSSKVELRAMIAKSQPTTEYIDGMQIGKSHKLKITTTNNKEIKIQRHGQQILVSLPANKSINDNDVIRAIRDAVISALRVQAKSYLPRRMSYLSDKLALTYSKVRFSHASGRWGSCSSSGTISLNIALMKLPFELIDYVIVHELAHTRHMNHSQEFWRLVELADADYKLHRRALKLESPSI